MHVCVYIKLKGSENKNIELENFFCEPEPLAKVCRLHNTVVWKNARCSAGV